MIIRVCGFTNSGRKVLEKLKTVLEEDLVEEKPEDEALDPWVADCFRYQIPILFIGAMGIAVRKIAPFVSDKLSDSPVLVMDEEARYVIPVLSGHIGGANRIANKIARQMGCVSVITTATDVQNLFAVDIFAVKNGLRIMNRDGIKAVSGKLLREGTIRMQIHPEIAIDTSQVPKCIELLPFSEEIPADVVAGLTEKMENPNENCLFLVWKPYIMGIGCKKNTAFEKLEAFVDKIAKENAISLEQVAQMASIDLKRKERGLLVLEAKKRIPFIVFSAEELNDLEGDFTDSEFVKSITGVSNVCERAAFRLSGEGEQILPKTASDGMTLSIYKRKAGITTWEM